MVLWIKSLREFFHRRRALISLRHRRHRQRTIRVRHVTEESVVRVFDDHTANLSQADLDIDEDTFDLSEVFLNIGVLLGIAFGVAYYKFGYNAFDWFADKSKHLNADEFDVQDTDDIKYKHDSTGKVLGAGNRVNNILNIRYANQGWQGSLGAKEFFGSNGKSIGKFEVFSDPAYGLRAAIILNRTYKRRNAGKKLTLSEYINKFAPATENDTSGYIDKVSKATGIKEDELVDLDDREQFIKIIKAQAVIENRTTLSEDYLGRVYDWVNNNAPFPGVNPDTPESNPSMAVPEPDMEDTSNGVITPPIPSPGDPVVDNSVDDNPFPSPFPATSHPGVPLPAVSSSDNPMPDSSSPLFDTPTVSHTLNINYNSSHKKVIYNHNL